MVQLVCKILYAFFEEQHKSTRSGDEGIWTAVIDLFDFCNKALEEIDNYLEAIVVVGSC